MPTNEKLWDVYPCQLMAWFGAQYNSNDITKHTQPMWGRKDEILLPHVLWLFIAIHFFPKDKTYIVHVIISTETNLV